MGRMRSMKLCRSNKKQINSKENRIEMACYRSSIRKKGECAGFQYGQLFTVCSPQGRTSIGLIFSYLFVLIRIIQQIF